MEVVLEQLSVPLVLRGVEGVVDLQLLHQGRGALRLESPRPELGEHSVIESIVGGVQLLRFKAWGIGFGFGV